MEIMIASYIGKITGLQLKILLIKMVEFVQLFQIQNIISFHVHHGLKLVLEKFHFVLKNIVYSMLLEHAILLKSIIYPI